MTGEFRGAAHSGCNLKARTNYEIPIFVHNLKGYDAHLLFQEIGAETAGNLSVIATNNEKYISFAVTQKLTPEEIAMMKDGRMPKTKPWKLAFKDSCQFLPASLEKLAENLRDQDFNHTVELAKEYGVPLAMLRRKGLYPYEWVDSEARFSETSLPSRESFYSKLADKCHLKKNTIMPLRFGERLAVRHLANIMTSI